MALRIFCTLSAALISRETGLSVSLAAVLRLITFPEIQEENWFKLALYCTIASVLGGLLGYAIGWGAWELVGDPIVTFYNGHAVIEKVKIWYENYGFWGVLIAAITPIPYKVFTIASGSMHFDLIQFTTASILGRGLRFFAVAWLIHRYGVRVKPFLEKHFEWATLVFTALLILGFLAIKYAF